ncbi:MAG: MFS transporter [Micromonosporaceae bacterium]
MRARLIRTFQSLTVRNYRLFATGQLVKLTGVWIMFVAQDWLVLQLSDDSAAAVGIVVALQFTPLLLLTLVGGALADRYDKRKLLILANSVFAGLAVGFALLVVSGVVQLWHVYVFAALLGIVNSIETPTRQAFVSELVGTTLLPNALSLNASVFNVARIAGPAAAGVAIATVGLGPTFLIATLAAISPVVSLLRMRPAELYREETPASGGRRPAGIRDGLRYVWHRHDLVLAMTLVAVVGVAGFNFQVTLPVLSKVVHDTGAAAFGVLATCLAVGSLAGALAGSWRRSRPSAYLVIGAAVGFGAFAVLVGVASTYWLVALLLLPTGFFAIFFAQAANQRVQLGCEAGYRGRVMALYVLVFLGTTPLGSLAVGWWSEHFGPESAIWMGGAVSLLAGATALLWQLRRHGEVLRVRIRPVPRLYVARVG